jgi:hypothetical protein
MPQQNPPPQTPDTHSAKLSLKERLPRLSVSLSSANASTQGDVLTISTGAISREFTWTATGLVTTGLHDLRIDKDWGNSACIHPSADWSFPSLTEGNANLRSLSAAPSTDDGFTTEHLQVVAEIEYPNTGITLKFVIWAYPDAPGLRTQLWLKGTDHSTSDNAAAEKNVSLAVLSGKICKQETSAQSNGLQSVQVGHYIQAPEKIDLKVEGLKQDRDYKAMATCWATGETASLSIDALSLDGESRAPAVPPIDFPLATEGPVAKTIGFDIPEEVRTANSVHIQIKRESGASVSASELWIYESGATPDHWSLDDSNERIVELTESAPKGYHLAAYMDYSCTTENSANTSERRVDYLPISEGQLTGFGYFNNTQNRHTEAHHISKQERLIDEEVDWASVLFVESETGGLAWVKESHKCVNRSGVDTGNFVRDAAGLHNYGSGLSAEFIESDYRWCWASWVVLYPEATADARELAMKQFDRARFPIDATRDIWVKANTWGSGDSNIESAAKASEHEVLKELDSVSDLGIDLLQIDDGWQKGRTTEVDAKTHEWHAREDWYPNGWSTVRKTADDKGIQLGLWTAYTAKLEDLKRNFDAGGFVTWKYDFAHIDNYENLFHHWNKFRKFILYTDHKARMALDVTENAPRFGYFWARDFGCIWLANRKPNYPVKTIPKPTLLLRDNRELAEYVNFNKFELPIQNFDRVNPQESDAPLYGASYGVALGLTGIPTFFQTTYYYEKTSRDAVRALLSVYKKEQAALYHSYVFAIGDTPNGAAWSGFQWIHPESQTGYLLIFRERLNTETSRALSLRFSQPGESLKVTDLRTGQASQRELDQECRIALQIQNPADFTFLKYTATKR